MKKLLLILLCVPLIGLGQERYHIDEVTSTNKKTLLLYLKKDMSLVSGKVTERYKNGQLKYERNYKDGKRDGLSTWWYQNGQLMIEEQYKYGELIRIRSKCWGPVGNKIDCYK